MKSYLFDDTNWKNRDFLAARSSSNESLAGQYDSLYNLSFAHLFLLAAFRSKLLEYSCNLRLSRSLNHFR